MLVRQQAYRDAKRMRHAEHHTQMEGYACNKEEWHSNHGTFWGACDMNQGREIVSIQQHIIQATIWEGEV